MEDDQAPARARPARLRRVPAWLGLILAFTLLRGMVWAFLIPPLDAPDEPSHLLAVAQMQAIRGLPVARLLDPNTVSDDSTPRSPALLTYLAQYRYTHFRALPYESTQPPLYYMLCAVVTAPFAADPRSLLYACRLVSALLGTLAVLAAARAAATLAPGRPAFARGVPLALALWPQFGFQTATVTNDIGLDLAGAGLAWAWAAAVRAPAERRWPLLLGLLTAAGVLTKLTMLATLPGSALVLLGRSWGHRLPAGRLRRYLGEAGAVGVPVALLVGPWVWRNWRVYGEPMGAAAMFSVIHGIYTTRLHVSPDTRFLVPPLDQFAWFSFSSFWAVFGWRGVFLPAPLYAVAALISGLAIAGAAAWTVRHRRGGPAARPAAGWALAAYALTAGAAVGAYILYTVTTDASFQGRYTFVALIPFCTIAVGGCLYATPRPAWNRVLARLALAGLLLIEGAAWLVIGRP